MKLLSGCREARASRIAAGWTLGAFLISCTAWHEKRPPQDYVRKEAPRQARVTHSDGSVSTLEATSVRRDSLIGVAPPGRGSSGATQPVSVPLADVRKLEVRETDTLKTVALVGGLILLGAIVVTAALASAAIGNIQ